MDYDTVLARLMVERGFELVKDDPPTPLFERTLDDVPRVHLPDGFTMQGVKNLHDGRLRASVTHGTFGTDNDWDCYAAEYANLSDRSSKTANALSLYVRLTDRDRQPARSLSSAPA